MKIKIGLIGLGFGAEFLPIYQSHPDAEVVAICQRNPESLNALGDAFGVAERYTDWRELIQDPEIDAVYVGLPVVMHAPIVGHAETQPGRIGRLHKRPRLRIVHAHGFFAKYMLARFERGL